MNRLTRIAAVTLWMLAPAAAAAQTTPVRLPDWVAHSAAVVRESRAMPSATAQTEWAPVIRLRAGDRFMVTIDRWGSAQERTFVQADSQSVTFLKLALPISDAAKRALKNAVLYHTDDVAGVPAGRAVRIDDLELTSSGVNFRGARIADLDAVIERVSRGSVVRITGRPGQKGSEKAAAAGIGIGLGLGFLDLLQATDSSTRNLGGFGIFWMPVAGGLVGYYATSRDVPGTVVYSR